MATKTTKTAKSAKTETTAIIKVLGQPEKPYRMGSARDLYFQRIQKFNGKPLDAFKEDVAANVPSMPTKGKLAGKPEPVNGWISYFVNEGLVEIVRS